MNPPVWRRSRPPLGYRTIVFTVFLLPVLFVVVVEGICSGAKTAWDVLKAVWNGDI